MYAWRVGKIKDEQQGPELRHRVEAKPLLCASDAVLYLSFLASEVRLQRGMHVSGNFYL